MLALLSPAKRLDFDSPPTVEDWSTPALLDESQELMSTTRGLSQRKIRELMGVSADLARLSAHRFAELTTELSPDNAKQALLTFSGDTYLGLDAKSLRDDDMAFAQDHLAVLSGLYGLLRPLDLIQPYRLEMGTKLRTRRGRNLYDFWGDRIQREAHRLLEASGSDVLVNLASKEYFEAVRPKTLRARVITPRFLETRNGRSRILSMFAKKARGMTARYLVQRRLTDPEDLRGFDRGGYRYREDLTEGDTWVFEREQPPPVR